jgi:hypothetical protein
VIQDLELMDQIRMLCRATPTSPNGKPPLKKSGTRPWAAYSRVGRRLLHPDISGGKEKRPIPFTNDVDDDRTPLEIDYITDLRWVRFTSNVFLKELWEIQGLGSGF